jgi:hypothetical protein
VDHSKGKIMMVIVFVKEDLNYVKDFREGIYYLQIIITPFFNIHGGSYKYGINTQKKDHENLLLMRQYGTNIN